MTGIGNFIDLLTGYVTLIVPLLLSLAILVFFWGIVKFITHAGDEKAREEGKNIMIWGMVVIFVMVALWAIVGYLQESIGLNTSSSLGANPALPTALPP